MARVLLAEAIDRLRPSRRNAELIGHSHQIDQRSRSHLAHHVAAMDLHGHLTQLEFVGNLFVQAASDDEGQDFLFAWRRLIPLFQVCLDVVARCELPICADCRVG